MAFLIRTISHSAEGREIVRPSRVEGQRLTIGRDPECDIHLTDLAVALRHVTVSRVAGRLTIETEAGLTVEVNGRKARSAVIEAATGGDILIASHLLRFMPTPAGACGERPAEAGCGRALARAASRTRQRRATARPSRTVA